MKKYLILVLIVLIIGTLVIGVQVASGKVTKVTGKYAVEIVPTRDIYPGYGSDDNQLPEAKGKVNMIQPNGNVDVILGVSVDRLHANTEYIVYFDTTGNDDNGPWALKGYFTTDECGHGDWNYTAPAGTLDVGPYTWSVAINRMDNETVLISNDIEFAIVPE